MMKILLLEDNERLANLVASALKNESYKVDIFSDGEEALEACANGYQCLILDINVPSLDGISVLEAFRTYNDSIPVIIISSNYELDKIQTSYETGCDEYLKKPFFMYELIHKIKKLCKYELKLLDFGNNILFDYTKHSLTKDEEDIKLAKKEILFLELLGKDINRVFSFDEIEEYVWEGEPTTLINIRALVKRLRKKIPEKSIKIVKGLGYSLNAQEVKIV